MAQQGRGGGLMPPGIADALLTTRIGLIAAIPSGIIYYSIVRDHAAKIAGTLAALQRHKD